MSLEKGHEIITCLLILASHYFLVFCHMNGHYHRHQPLSMKRLLLAFPVMIADALWKLKQSESFSPSGILLCPCVLESKLMSIRLFPHLYSCPRKMLRGGQTFKISTDRFQDGRQGARPEWKAEENVWSPCTWKRKLLICHSSSHVSTQKSQSPLCYLPRLWCIQHCETVAFQSSRLPCEDHHISHRPSRYLCSQVCTKPLLSHLVPDAKLLSFPDRVQREHIFNLLRSQSLSFSPAKRT